MPASSLTLDVRVSGMLLDDFTAGTVDGQVRYAIGGSVAGDGAEGYFVWDEDSAVAADGVLVVSAGGTGRWIRQLPEPGVLNARWWGMLPSASAATNAAALQAAIDACEECWTVVVPTDGFTGYANQYAMTGTVTIGTYGVTLVGTQDLCRADEKGPALVWSAAGGLSIEATDVTIKNLVISAGAGVSTPWLIEWDGSGTGTFRMKGVRLSQHVTATVTDALRIGETAMNNVEHGLFEDCAFVTTGESLVRIGGSGSGQSKRHRFRDCYFQAFNQPPAQRSMMGINCVTGSFVIDGGAATSLERLVNLVAPSEACSILEMDTEQCKRFVDFASGDTPTPVATGGATNAGPVQRVAVSIRGGRHSTSQVATASANLTAGDVQAIWCASGVFSTIAADYWHQSGSTAFKIKTYGGPCIAIGNSFPNNDVFVHRERVFAFGNVCGLAAGYPDEINGYVEGPEIEQYLGYFDPTDLRAWRPTLMNTVTPHGLTSADWWNANGTHTKNLGGSITISGANTEGAVTFARNEADTNYKILFGLEHTTGASLATSVRMKVGTKAVGGFTAQLDAAPGGTDVVTVNWFIMR